MKYAFAFFMIIPMIANTQIRYPETRKDAQTDNYHGTTVADPYRWLEDDNSTETKAWVEAQQRLTSAYLHNIPFRQQVQNRLTQLWNYPKYGSPSQRGSYLYFSKNDGLQNQAVIYRQQGRQGTPEVFIDPNKLAEDGTAALGSLSFSENNKYAAYLVARSGSDWQEGYVLDVATARPLPDKLEWIKFSGLAWVGDEGFYYSRYPAPAAGKALSGKNEFHQVWYHKMGTPQAADLLVYKDEAHPLRTAYAQVTEDKRYLIINVSEGTSGAMLLVKDLKAGPSAPFITLVPNFDTEPSVIDNDGDKLLVRTNDGAPNYKVVLIDPKQPARQYWKTLIAEKPEVLEGVGTAGGMLFASYLKDASTQVFQHRYNGALVRQVALPGIGTAGGFGARRGPNNFFYTFTSFNEPGPIYEYHIESGNSSFFRRNEAPFNPNEYETHQVFFKSKDGTRVPMFVSHKKGLVKNGNNPVMLYGYGGFNIALTATFSIANLFFMEQGGIYVQVNLRGGSEYGEAWHKAGMLQNKQNVFDDFIAAAEYLINEKYTQPKKIAISGGSNGGLLVGACMVQRPDLFGVALPQVGVLDMLRYHKFTIGWAWAVEYGSADKPEDFAYLYKYSPLHNLKDGTAYPATLIMTADHDDRVVPAHSFKFAARLQAAHTGPNPVLIRIDSKAGHGAGTPTSKLIEAAADRLAFTMYHLGMDMP